MDEVIVPAPAAEPAPVAEPAQAPAPAPPPEAQAPPVKEERRETIARLMNTPPPPGERGRHARFQPRDGGRFAGPPAAPAESVVPAPVPAPVRPDMPKSLRLELKPHWDTAHPDLAAAIHQRELDYDKGVQPLKAARAQLDELLAEFKPYETMLRAENTTPKAAVAALLQTAAVLRSGSPEAKASAAAAMMRQYGISLEHVQQMFASGPAPAQPASDPQVQLLTQQVQQLTALQQQANETRALSIIREFAADPEHKHFEAVKDRIGLLLQSQGILGADVESLSERELLGRAYETAIRLTPEVHALVLAEQQAKEKAKTQVAQSRSAAVQVKGAPAAGPVPKPNPKDRREIIRNAFHAQR